MPSTPFPPRWRRRWRAWRRRSSLAWWGSAVLLALLTGGVVRATLVRTSAVLDELGPLRTVPVVVRPVAVGEVVGEGDLGRARRPSSMLPSEGLAVDAVGRVAVVPLVPGEVMLASKLAPDGLRGAAALLPAGMRALAIPGGPGGRPPASVGDLVDVLATFANADADGGTAPTVVVAAAARVLALDDESDTVTVAVPADEAPAVASALTAATITLALRSP